MAHIMLMLNDESKPLLRPKMQIELKGEERPFAENGVNYTQFDGKFHDLTLSFFFH